MTSALRLTISGSVARITFTRPERLNAIGLDTALAFEAAVSEALATPGLRLLVLASEGRAFVAGGDLSHFQGRSDRDQAAEELILPMHRALLALSQSPVLTLACLKGAVAGAGMSLALATDLAIAEESTVLTMAYSKVGTTPDCGGSYWLPRLLGARRALEVALLSEPISAAEAQRLGLINRVVADGTLEAETEALIQRLLAGAPAAQAATKALIAQSDANSLEGQLQAEVTSFAACAQTLDFEGAVDAFLNRRKPVFTGR